MLTTLLGRLQQRRTDDTEFDQALSRMILSPIIFGYFYIVFSAGKIDLGGNSSWLFTTALFAHLSAFALLLHIYHFSGHYLLRRTIAMAQDFSCVGILLAVGGEAMLPAFCILFRITVGYGIRYGGRFIFLSPILGQATLGIVILSSDYWYNNAYLSAAFILTLFIGPVYAFGLTAKLQEARRLARDASERKSRFVAQVSHDLRQPIHAISLLTARLADSDLSSEQGELLRKVDRSVQSAIQQLQTFLNVTTIEAGMLQPRKEPVNIGHMLIDQVIQQKSIADSNGNAVHAFNSTATVMTDSIFLATIVQNLLSNAIKYAPGSDILIGCRRKDGQLALCVYDRGPGIAPENLQKLTDRFFRVKDSQKLAVEGFGLGMSIVKQLTEALGLQVVVRSEQGKGTAIWIIGLDETDADVAEPHAAYALTHNQLNGMKIVVIEDDPETLESTCHLLEKWGCCVTGHLSPPLKLEDCDVIVSDFEFSDGSVLPDHANLCSSKTPLVIVSGHSRDTITQRLKRSKAIILEKPLQASELRSALMSTKFLDQQPIK